MYVFHSTIACGKCRGTNTVALNYDFDERRVFFSIECLPKLSEINTARHILLSVRSICCNRFSVLSTTRRSWKPVSIVIIFNSVFTNVFKSAHVRAHCFLAVWKAKLNGERYSFFSSMNPFCYCQSFNLIINSFPSAFTLRNIHSIFNKINFAENRWKMWNMKSNIWYRLVTHAVTTISFRANYCCKLHLKNYCTRDTKRIFFVFCHAAIVTSICGVLAQQTLPYPDPRVAVLIFLAVSHIVIPFHFLSCVH